MQRLLASLILVLILLIVGCAPAPEPTATPEPTTAPDVLKTGIVIAVENGEEDGGFNELSIAGVRSVSRRLGGEFETRGVDSETTVADIIEQFATDGSFDVIVTVGFATAEDTIAGADAYPDIHFIGIDQFQTEERPNLTGIIFRDDHAGFLAGVLAGTLTETDIVGGVFGPNEVQPIRAFAAGYEAGVAHANPDADVIITFHPGTAAEGFTDLRWGEATAQEQLVAGADVIFTAAGDTGRGALIQVANQVDDADTQLYCIGVDTDQWVTAPQARPCLVSSALKFIPPALDEVIEQVNDGSPPVGNYFGPVELADFHDFADRVPNGLSGEITRIQNDLTTGVLDTGYNE